MVEECAVIAVEDDVRVHVPVAFLKLKNSDEDIEKVKQYIKDVAEPYNIPTEYYVLSEIPIRPNGKTDYQELKKMNTL